jgi:hypothetical protein
VEEPGFGFGKSVLRHGKPPGLGPVLYIVSGVFK